MITPEMARRELERRRAEREQNVNQITPEMARRELQRRRVDGVYAQKEPEPSEQAPEENLPSFSENLRRAFEETGGALHQVNTNPLRAGKVAAASALNTAQGLYNFITRGINIHDNRLGIDSDKKLNTDYNKFLGISNSESGDEFLSLLPLMATPELIPTKGLSALGKLGARGVETEAFSQGQGGNPGDAALLTAALESPALAKAAYKGRYAIPAKMFKGTATPEERAANAEAAGDLPVHIGKITQSPAANVLYENILEKVPFSGVSKQQKEVALGAEERGNSLLKMLEGENTDLVDPNVALREKLFEAKQNAREEKNRKYEELSNLAEKENHQLDLPVFANRMKEIGGLLDESPLLKGNPKLRSFVKKMSGYEELLSPSEILGPTGEKMKGTSKAPSIRDANLVKNDFYNAGESLSKSIGASDRYMGSIYKELAGLIGEDIQSSIKNTGSEALQEAHKSATEEYKNNYAKYIDKKMFKYLEQDKSDTLARDIITPGRKRDSYKNIEKVQGLLPEKEQNLLPYAYLSNALDENKQLNIKKLGGLLNDLGPRQYNELFRNPNIREKAQEYGTLRGMSENALNQMHNPKTGAQVAPWLMINDLLMGSLHAGTAGASILGAQFLSKAMTSPKIRKNLLEQMEKGKTKQPESPRSLIDLRDLKDLLARVPRETYSNQNGGRR